MDERERQQIQDQRSHRLAVAACCAVGAILFWTVGRLIIRPLDPLGPLSLVLRSAAEGPVAGAESMILLTLKIAAIAAITSVTAAALVGRRLPEAGAFAVAFGLLSLTPETAGMRSLLTVFDVPGATADVHSIVYHKLIRESICWFAVMLVSLIATRLVEQWLGGHSGGPGPEGGEGGHAAPSANIMKDDDMILGMLAAAVAAVGAAVVMAVTCRSDAKGQVYFSLLVSFFAGTVLAHRICRTQLGVWYCLSVLMVAVAGYWWAARPSLAAARPGALLTVPPLALARPLPVEYMSWGTAGAIAGFWFATRSLAAQKAKQGQ